MKDGHFKSRIKNIYESDIKVTKHVDIQKGTNRTIAGSLRLNTINYSRSRAEVDVMSLLTNISYHLS